MKADGQVIQEFNRLVNLDVAELERWLKTPESKNAGWTNGDNGETVGHDSGRKIVAILKANPDKDPDKYTKDQIQHMRKVAAYCKRHLAQEKNGLTKKSEAEAKKTESYKSLMNWGHDPLKGTSSSRTSPKKRKTSDSAPSKDASPSPKRRETRASRKAKATRSSEDGKDGKDGKDGEQNSSDSSKKQSKPNNRSKSKVTGGSSSKKAKGKGDTVSWNWGGGQPTGRVKDIKPHKATITTKNENKVSRDGDEDDPAVILDTGRSDAIKLAHEINEAVAV